MARKRDAEWMQLPIKKVAIVGGAPSRKEAPISDPTWEIWGLGPRQLKLPRVTRWFEMHSKEQLINYYDVVRGGYFKKHWTFLQRLKCPVYTQRTFPDLPNSVEYPLEDVIEDVGKCFTSSVSYMLGLAIHEKFEGIGMWGVNMASKKEYKYQWPAVQYLLALARKRGIHVYLPESCPITIPKKPKLVKTKILYGYDWDHPDAWWNKKKKPRKLKAKGAKRIGPHVKRAKGTKRTDGKSKRKPR